MNKLGYIFIALIFRISSLSAQTEDLHTEIDKIIRFDTEIDYKKTPGFIISVIDNDKSYCYSFGSKIRSEKENILADDIYELGSVSKVLTSWLIKILTQENIIHLEDKVNNYLPDEWKNPRLASLTIYDLVQHHSGLPRRPAYFGKKEKDGRNPYSNYTQIDVLKYYRDFIPKEKKFEYSHTNYAILELIIERATGKSFQDVMDEKVFKPLTMNHTFIDFPEQKENLINPGYDRSKKLVNPWTFQSFKASEGVKSSSNDLIKLVKTILNDAEMSMATSTDGFNKKLGVTMGWHSIHIDDFDILTHTGKTTGHSAFISMVRETKTAVIILANSSVGTEDLGLQILRMINYNWKRSKV
ncbi:MAG: beta-lactamase family protein [Saprospiraceae bacterium]|nr:beta-lactamase family protein [Saprospiraceae bacterium]